MEDIKEMEEKLLVFQDLESLKDNDYYRKQSLLLLERIADALENLKEERESSSLV